MACFAAHPAVTVQALKDRFLLNQTDKQVEDQLQQLIFQSCGSHYTKLYDVFQYYSQGVL